jgi:hypothetical protein
MHSGGGLHVILEKLVVDIEISYSAISRKFSGGGRSVNGTAVLVYPKTRDRLNRRLGINGNASPQ